MSLSLCDLGCCLCVGCCLSCVVLNYLLCLVSYLLGVVWRALCILCVVCLMLECCCVSVVVRGLLRVGCRLLFIVCCFMLSVSCVLTFVICCVLCVVFVSLVGR